MRLIERLITALFPQWALRRARARRHLAEMDSPPQEREWVKTATVTGDEARRFLWTGEFPRR
jgi:hypothetical protein